MTMTTRRTRPQLPHPRGPLSQVVVDALHRNDPRSLRSATAAAADDVDALTDDDTQLALACCYELHYESFEGVEDSWEWNPDLLAVCAGLEQVFTRRLEDAVGPVPAAAASAVVPALRELAHGSSGPSLSTFMERRGRLEHIREFCVHRSAYQLKEADPHTWMIPRLRGRAKAAAVTIQYDEYGQGAKDGMHAELFATTMRALDLDPTYGFYLDRLPATTLATGNLVSMFGLHRGWRAACVGHLALFEMTSVGPMGRYSAALERFGVNAAARRFYDVHVEADAWHEQVAQDELVRGVLAIEPTAGGNVIFGARALMEVEGRMTEALLDAWSDGTTSLLAPLPARRVAS
jgi:hypothetical protein